MSIDLAALGLTPEDLAERVVDAAVERLLSSSIVDDEGDEQKGSSFITAEMRKRIRERVDARIGELAEKHVLPQVTTMLETITLQETNSWGEKTGKPPVGFVEYLAQRADAYMREKVDGDGKSKDENSYGHWRGDQTRITHLVHKHLHHSIETAMKQSLAIANGAIADGIAETVKAKLAEITAKLQVSVATPR